MTAQKISGILGWRGTMKDSLRVLKQQDGEVTAFSGKALVRLVGLCRGLHGWPPDLIRPLSLIDGIVYDEDFSTLLRG